MLSFLTTVAWAGGRPPLSSARLARLRHEMRDLSRALTRSKARVARVRIALRHTTRRIDATERALSEIGQKTARAEKRKAALELHEQVLEVRLRESKRQLLHLIRVRFMLGSKQRLRFLLESGSVNRLDRLLGEWRWIDQAAAADLQRSERIVQRLSRAQLAVSGLLDHLRAIHEARERTMTLLGADRARRAALLYALSNRLSESELRLRAVRHHYRELSTLLEHLPTSPAFTEAGLGRIDQVPFGRLRGHLPWPVRGTVVRGFGSAEAGGLLLSHGLWISARPGARVRAVAHGQVVFSGWLPHFGLLLIVAQGQGYYTVYARNALLYDAVGDWVNAGEPLGRLHRSHPAELYFQIRRGAQPIDPAPWLTPGG